MKAHRRILWTSLCLLGSAFCVLPAQAQEGGPPQPPSPVEEGERLLAALDRLLGADARVLPLPAAECTYRLTGMAGSVTSGSLQTSWRTERHRGRAVYRIRRDSQVTGRRQEEESLVDAASFLPYTYTRRVHQANGQVLENWALWDHLGTRAFFGRNVLKDGQIVRDQSRDTATLGKEFAFDVRDPLGVEIAYRDRCRKEGKATSWSAEVLEAFDEKFVCTFTPLETSAHATNAAAGAVPPVGVDQVWEAKTPDTSGRKVRIWLAPDKDFLPVRYSGGAYGLRGHMDLAENRPVPTP